MKTLFLVCCMFLFTSMANASPFLISDPQPGDETTGAADTYVISETGQPDVTIGAIDFALKYDLGGITEGKHDYSVKACNVWGCSSASPFSFTKSLPASPIHIRLSSD